MQKLLFCNLDLLKSFNNNTLPVVAFMDFVDRLRADKEN